MALQEQILDQIELTSLADSVNILVQPPGASKAYRSTLGAVRAGLAKLISPSFSGTVQVPTPPTNDVSTRAASTTYVDNRSRLVFEELKQLKQIQTSVLRDKVSISSTVFVPITTLNLPFTPTRSDSKICIEVFMNGLSCQSSGIATWGALSLGWNGTPQIIFSDVIAYMPSSLPASSVGGSSAKFIFDPNHNGLVSNATRTYQVFAKVEFSSSLFMVNHATGSTNTGYSSIIATEIVI